MTSTVLSFEDKDIHIVKLGYGKYLVDDEFINIRDDKEVRVRDYKNIRKVTENTFISHYSNIETGETMSVIDRNEKLKELYTHGYYKTDYDEDITWNTLEDEYNYKKFNLQWTPIRKTIQEISDPIQVEIVKAKYNTGNKFITNAYLNNKGDRYDMYIYNQEAACKYFVQECFNDLKMEFEEKCHYTQTKNKKIWGNSSDGIRYTVAFGDEWRSLGRRITGTLDDLLARAEKDRNSLRKIIKTKYNTTFGKVDISEIDFGKVLNNLYSLRGSINSIESKKATWSEQNSANKKVNKIIEYIENKFEE